MIGQRQGGLPQLGGALRHLRGAAHAVEQGVFGMDVQVDKIIGHRMTALPLYDSANTMTRSSSAKVTGVDLAGLMTTPYWFALSLPLAAMR